MKKIENSFAVTGFIGKDAEIRSFETASVARFSIAVSVPINSRQGQKQTSLCRAQERKEIDDYGKNDE